MKIPDRLIKLVENFNSCLELYRSGQLNETQTRVQFINPFFECLGWDINNKQGVFPEF